MLDAITLPFLQRALLAGMMVGFLASYYGVFIFQRRLSFLGSGLSHAAFGGVALGLLLGTEPLWIAVPFTVIVAFGITRVREQTKLGGDTAIGIFFSVSVAPGVVFLSLKRQYTVDAFAYLFGSILNVTRSDLLATAILMLISLFSWPLWGRRA